MQLEKLRFKAFGRRAAVLAIAKLVLLGGLCGRLYYLQVVESKRYKMLADENRINLRLLAPPRGHIVDRFGTPLAQCGGQDMATLRKRGHRWQGQVRRTNHSPNRYLLYPPRGRSLGPAPTTRAGGRPNPASVTKGLRPNRALPSETVLT